MSFWFVLPPQLGLFLGALHIWPEALSDRKPLYRLVSESPPGSGSGGVTHREQGSKHSDLVLTFGLGFRLGGRRISWKMFAVPCFHSSPD